MTSEAMQIIKYVWPLIIIQFGTQIYALVDLFRKKKTKVATVPIWAAIILLGNLLGAVLYLLVGKIDDVYSD